MRIVESVTNQQSLLPTDSLAAITMQRCRYRLRQRSDRSVVLPILLSNVLGQLRPDSFMIIKDGEAPLDPLSSLRKEERERETRETLKARVIVRYSRQLSFSHSSGHLYAFAASSRIRFFFVTPGRRPSARFTSLSENPR